jgi:uroporphyrinogen-III decarboxylase
MRTGNPDEIQAEVRRLKAEMGAGGGYILAPAKSLQPETPTANAVALVEAFIAS